MYDDLILRLREAAKMSEALAVLLPHSEGNATAKLYNEAADAIEELIPFKKQVEKGMGLLDKADELLNAVKPRWIPVTEDTPSDFVSVQAHMTDAGNFPSVREAYTIDKLWFFPALKEFHPVDKWRRFDEPTKEE